MRPFSNQFLRSVCEFYEKSYFILSAHRPVIFVNLYDAPFELTDEAIVKRLECQVYVS